MSKQNNSGFTLVEIAVSMLIIFIVLGGVYKTIGRENIDLEREEIILDMQNNARIAMDRISAAVRSSGFMGCSGELLVNDLSNADPDPDNAGSRVNLLSTLTSAMGPAPAGVSGVDDWDPSTTLMTYLKNDTFGQGVIWLGESIGFFNDATDATPPHDYYNEGTDAITLGYLTDEVALDPANSMTVGTDDPEVLPRDPFDQWDILMITDCEDYSLFQKTNTTDNTAPFTLAHAAGAPPAPPIFNSTGNLGKDYGSKAQARVFKLNFETFFIRDDLSVPPKPTLYHNSTNRPIASNIQDLQFEFYFDLDQDDDLTEPAEWLQSIAAAGAPFTSKDVRAVRIWILARSEPVSGYTNTTSYVYPTGAAPVVFGDNVYRYLASTEIYIRNAGLKE